MQRPLVLLSLIGGMALFATTEARAQFLVSGPGGSLGIRNGNGTYTYVYPQRLMPSANFAQPGTYQQTPQGDIWLGYDNQVHGNLVDPSTGDLHVRAPRQSRGTAPQRRRYDSGQARQYSPQANGPRRSPGYPRSPW